jgi:transcriptional regulator with XRE-family HTH domain
MAQELGTTNVTIARWEAGVRRPNERNWTALADLAGKKGLMSLGLFFTREAEKGKAKPSERLKEKNAIRDLDFREYFAAAGEEESEKVLRLSKRSTVDYAREVGEQIAKARALKNGAFAVELGKITDEASDVKRVREGRVARARRAIELLKQWGGKSSAPKLDNTEFEDVRRTRIRQILSSMKEAANRGEPLDPYTALETFWRALGLGWHTTEWGWAFHRAEHTTLPLGVIAEACEEILDRELAGNRPSAEEILSRIEQALGVEGKVEDDKR